MIERIEYQVEKYSFAEIDETPRIRQQWAEVIQECREVHAGSTERLRIALLNVDYVTSFELPFRLLLIRTPQLIDRLRDDLQLGQKTAVMNGKSRGQVYSLGADLSDVPDAFRYRLSSRIRRVQVKGATAVPYQQIARQTKAPRERLRLALEAGLQVNALDGLFWLGLQRIAADVLKLRQSGMAIATSEVEVVDTLTGTQRTVAAYQRESYLSAIQPEPIID
ncbi:DNA-binding protein [Serratia sp. JSRIV001]|uniref:DNA-binding protein n=1 Tax=unclassified Serratia (in: enterobacteria) TaxID=2647522 RepID=UPI001CBD70FC|nr:MULTISPECIES: DNA-binding protein [unclassified Serratia (in: enterobacteria)]UAN43955.1 DNA-binding protein [Serratia sp. JSRIV001]UAN53533.1 DNA-binding protein [Serratia sp. JSRIV002]UAN58154.1 DNA-binding protein [Serratia sp. JSRIV004]